MMYDKLDFKWVEHLSEEWNTCVQLRDMVLRKPLGLCFSKEELMTEGDDMHLAAFYNDFIVGCLILSPQDRTIVKMRQVAVLPLLQGKGIGRAMVDYSEMAAHDRGYRVMMLHARKTVVPFYTQLGYSIYDKPFKEIGIPHCKMRKEL